MKQANNGMFILLIVLLIAVFVAIALAIVYELKLIPYEGEMTCNTGLIDIDFNSVWDNQPYKDNITISTECDQMGCINRKVIVTKYHREPLAQSFNFNKIDGLTCNIKFKGEMPLLIIRGMNKWKKNGLL